MKSYIFLLIIFAISIQSYAQKEIQKSNNIVVILDRKFYIHQVKKGETLFAISRVYQVPPEEIMLVNQDVVKKLQAGAVLKIPIINSNQVNNEIKYVFHTVQRKQSLYSIAKEYGVSETDIINQNPSVKSGMKPGEILKIPQYPKLPDAEDDYFVYHKVKPQETLFTLAQKYGVTIDQLRTFNNDTDNGLKVGQVLNIPKRSFTKSEVLFIKDTVYVDKIKLYDPLYFTDPSCPPCNEFKYDGKQTFKVALLLPLFLQENFNRSFDIVNNPNKYNYYKNSERFIEYMEGFLLAVNEYKANGLNLDIQIFDTENNPEKVKTLLQKPEFKKTDLIFGPIYYDNVKLVGNFAKEHRINLISPLSQRIDVLNDNPFIFQINPSNNTLIEKSANFFANYNDSCIILVHNGTEEELALVELYRSRLVRTFSTGNKVKEVVFKVINYKGGGFASVEDALSVKLNNIVVVLSSDEVFVTNLVNKLEKLVRDKKYNAILYGMPSWERFTNIELDFMENLKLHYPDHTYLDYSDWVVKNFVTKYRDIYKIEPSKYSFMGYDIANYFLGALKKYGKYFQFCISPNDIDPNPMGVMMKFDLHRINEKSGFENKGVFILKYDEKLNLMKAE